MTPVSVSTDTGIACTLSNGSTDTAGKYVATMTITGLGPSPMVGIADAQLG